MPTDRIPLTEEQIKNWRQVLSGVLGAYANLMPAEEIEKMAFMMQGDINDYSEELEKEQS